MRTTAAGFGAVFAALLVIAPWSDDESGWSEEDYKNYFRVELQDFDRIPLPVREPPRGAELRADEQVGPGVDMQEIFFAYNGFTVKVCSVDTAVTSTNPCREPASSVLRVVRDGAWVTTYSASTKFDSPLTDSKARRIVDFFRSGPVAPKPSWIDGYVDAKIKEMFG